MSRSRFGVNYVPSRGWWYSWTDWDDQSVREDLQAIAALGVDHIRIHCLWTLFQPNPTLVSSAMLDRLESLLDHADSAGLDAIVTVLDGWLSGFDFRPSWLVDDANIFVDEEVIAAQKRLLAAIAARVAEHPKFIGFDVANEPNVLSTEERNPTSGDEGDRWVTALLAHCDEVAPGGLHSVGMDHAPWLTDETAFSRNVLATTGSLTPVHCWSFFTGAFERYGEGGVGAIHLSEYMLELAKAFHRDPQRRVWVQEVGVAPEWLTDLSLESFVDRAMESISTVRDVWGVTWWASHDIDRSLSGFLDLEYDLGLLTVDNVLKPTGERFRAAIQRSRSDLATEPEPRSVALMLPTGVTPDLSFADFFFRLIEKGIHPAIILEERRTDVGYLDSRGIETIVDPAEEQGGTDS